MKQLAAETLLRDFFFLSWLALAKSNLPLHLQKAGLQWLLASCMHASKLLHARSRVHALLASYIIALGWSNSCITISS